jgi:hypothetical protein
VTTIDSESGLDVEERALCALRRYAQRPGLSWLAGLGDVHPAQRSRPVGAGPELFGQVGEEAPRPGALDVGDGYTVNTGCSSVVTDVTPRLPQDVAAGDVVIKGVEATVGI